MLRRQAIAGISHIITLDASLSERHPDALSPRELAQQPRWRWLVRACQLKGGVPCALLIEADTSYLLLVNPLADTAYEFGRDLYDALLMSLDIHPQVHKQPNDGMFSFDSNPDSICWQKGSATDLALQRRLNDTARQLATMSPAQGNATLAKLNEQAVTLANGSVVPTAVMQQRLDHCAEKWHRYLESTGVVKQIWNTWRKRKPWVSD